MVKPLNVALVYRMRSPEDGAELRDKIGLWSYPVPEFTWTGYGATPGFVLNRDDLVAWHDVIFHEDFVRGKFVGKAKIPLIYWVVDSNTSPRRSAVYRDYAYCASLVLVDQDDLDGWPVPTKRLPYAVDERMFKPGEKTVDIAYLVQPTAERRGLGNWLADFSRRHGYSLTVGSGLPVGEYAARLGGAKVVIHLATHPNCRSHRVFDALACGACLLTSPLPRIDGDGFIPGLHYLEWRDYGELGRLLHERLEGGWQEIADAGYNFVMREHTWQKRAKQLYPILNALL